MCHSDTQLSKADWEAGMPSPPPREIQDKRCTKDPARFTRRPSPSYKVSLISQMFWANKASLALHAPPHNRSLQNKSTRCFCHSGWNVCPKICRKEGPFQGIARRKQVICAKAMILNPFCGNAFGWVVRGYFLTWPEAWPGGRLPSFQAFCAMRKEAVKFTSVNKHPQVQPTQTEQIIRRFSEELPHCSCMMENFQVIESCNRIPKWENWASSTASEMIVHMPTIAFAYLMWAQDRVHTKGVMQPHAS